MTKEQFAMMDRIKAKVQELNAIFDEAEPLNIHFACRFSQIALGESGKSARLLLSAHEEFVLY